MNGPDSYAVKLANSAVLAVNVGATIYTDVFDLSGLDTFALSYQAACVSETPNVKIELEQGIAVPSPQNAADDGYVVPETLAEINASLIDILMHHQPIFPIGVKYLRFKITELSNTIEDTVLTMSLSVQNRF